MPALWRDLRRYTPARIALGRAGSGLPTAAHLAFQAAHAAARDAVHAAIDASALREALAAYGIDSLFVHSACVSRDVYLARPDLGRRLRDDDRALLQPREGMAYVICDGLSATAVFRHAASLLAALQPKTPVIVVEQGRVAIGDEIGEALGADAVLVLIGERPGLSAADSLGAYLTWQPRRGRRDSERNCISNIRPEGLSIPDAAAKLLWLIGAMRAAGLTGIALKDEQPRLAGQVA